MHNYENFHRVKEMIDARRTEAVERANLRRAELQMRSSEVATIDEELSKTGPQIFRAACTGADITPIRERNRLLLEARAKILDALGYPEDYDTVSYTCKECNDTGFLPNTKVCGCFKRLLYTENIKSSGIGSLIDEQSFENFDLSVYADNPEIYAKMNHVFSAARDFAVNYGKKYRGKNMLFMGKTGTGKTHLSTSIAKVLIEGGYYVLYDSSQNIVSAFENDKFKSGYGAYESIADKYLECELLIIDDLGTEFINQFTVSCLYNLINTRKNRGLSTIISTNLPPSELASKYEDRIYSRIVGKDYTVFFFDGKDYRLFGKK